MLPEAFTTRLQAIVPPEKLPQVLASFHDSKNTGFRVNTLKANPVEVVAHLNNLGLTPNTVGWCDYVFWVSPEQRGTLTHSPPATNGQIYVQGFSSIVASLVLDPQPDEWNLDLAAAPGGKSTHIVALMNNQGKLSVVEPIRKRMYRLADNLIKMGSTISKTYLMDGRKVGTKVPGRFDRVLLDAPCSGESRMRIDQPDSYQFWSPRKIREQSRKQRGLIESAFVALKPGGTLLYCTCSLAPEENEAVVTHLLKTFEDEAQLLPIDLPFGNWQPGLSEFESVEFYPDVHLTRRILPNTWFDAFYLARFRKRAADD